MRFMLLGTSSGIPTKTRNVSGCIVAPEESRSWCLIDCGEGTQHQLLKAPVSLLTLSAVFITHVHGDHCYGLPGLLATAGLQGRRAPLSIVAPKGIEQYVRAVLEHTDLFLPYELKFVSVERGAEVFNNKELKVYAHELSHRVPSFGYRFVEADVQPSLDVAAIERAGVSKGPLWGRLQRGEVIVLDNGKTLNGADFLKDTRNPREIIVAGDNDCPALLADACEHAQVLIHEATFTEEVLQKVGERVQHSSAQRLAKFAENVGINHLVLTHFSARFTESDDGEYAVRHIYEEALRYYHGNLIQAEDFSAYTLTKKGELKAGF